MSFGWRTVALTVIAIAVGLVTSVRAGSGSIAKLPLAGKKVTTGLSLEVDTEWLDGNGYRPVTISISPLGGGAAPADRTLDVTLRPRSQQWGIEMPNVSTSITLEQGQTVAAKTIAIPQIQSIGAVEIVTYEDGRRRDDLSESVGLAWTANAMWSEAAPTMLFIDADAPLSGRLTRVANNRFSATGKKDKKPERLSDIRPLALMFMTEHASSSLAIAGLDPSEDIDDYGLLVLVNALNRIEFLHPDQFPTEWVQLTSVGVVFVSMSDLRILNRDPRRWEALRAWLSSGTTLCVYDVGEAFSGIPELERLFELDRADPRDEEAADSEFQKRGWRAPRAVDYDDEVQATRGVQWNNNQWYTQPQAVDATPRNKNSSPPPMPDNLRPFLMRGVEHGQLVAFADENPFPGTREQWSWLFNSLNHQDWMWYQRHGLSQHRENPQYWNLLIPGVGDAPVNSFLVLISLFVVVIGPINYFMLGRRRKLYLLLLTVPLGAGVVTSALFTYALVNDGLGVRVRVRSLTRIDQTSGRTVSWSRQSYYAGLAPSAGMSFPVDAAIYPIDHRPTGRYGQPRDFGRRIRWSDEQRLAQGYLNSRSTAQLIVVESRDTKLGIRVDEPAGESATIRVTNELGVDIEQLLLCSSDRRALASGALPAGETVSLDEIDAKDFSTGWSKLFAAARPRYPVGFDPNQIDNASAMFASSYAWWQEVDRGLPAPTTTTSILERGLRGIGNLKPDAMRPRSYVALVRKAPDVSLGVDTVAEEASFHVVTGSW